MSPDRDKLAELANICAGHAAGALALLLDAVLLTEVPELRDLPAGRPLSALFPRDQRVAGIFADLRGAYPAKAALLLSAGAVEDVIERVAGKEASEVSAIAVLSELGNIAVSAAANALAQMLGGTSLPSVPRAGYAPQGELDLPELVRFEPELRVVAKVVLAERHGPLRFHFVLMPGNPDID